MPGFFVLVAFGPGGLGAFVGDAVGGEDVGADPFEDIVHIEVGELMNNFGWKPDEHARF